LTVGYDLRVIELLGEIRDELRAVRRLLEEARPRAEPGDSRYVELVAAIRSAAADRVFSSAELIAHCEVAPELGQAIAAAVGSLNVRKLGRALRRCEGMDVGGLIVSRIGQDSAGVAWRVRVSPINPETRAISFA
jgi:hypothetical protein